MLPAYRILKAGEIDPKKWDACIDRHEEGLIYARYIYLQAMAPGWKGIVFGDYAAIFPLCIKKKFGIKYLYVPAFTQQLGLIGDVPVSCEQCIKIIKDQVKYGHIAFNYSNKSIVPDEAKERTNFIIHLTAAHEHIFKKYNYTLKKDVQYATGQGLQLENEEFSVALSSYRTFLKEKGHTDYRASFMALSKLLTDDNFKHHFFVRKVVSREDETLAISLFLIDKKRIYNIIAVTFDKGKPVNAMHFLIDCVIKEFERTDLIFDFEGSEIPGVKNFYKRFSPQYQPYYHYYFNDLPFPLNKLKR